jgi:hypothetical protein
LTAHLARGGNSARLSVKQVSGRKAPNIASGSARIVTVNVMRAVRGIVTVGIVGGGIIATGGRVETVNITRAVRGVTETIGRIAVHHSFLTSFSFLFVLFVF